MGEHTLRARLENWIRDGYTDSETPLDGYGTEVLREVLAALAAPPPVPREPGKKLERFLKSVQELRRVASAPQASEDEANGR